MTAAPLAGGWGPDETGAAPGATPGERLRASAYPPGVPATYGYPPVPLTRLLDDAAKDFPEAEAVHHLGYSLSYRRLLDKVDRFAAALAGLGVGRGDRVALVLPNVPQHVVALFAVLRLGAVVVEISPTRTEEELAAQLNDSGSKVVICLDPGYPALAALKGSVPAVEHIVATGHQDALPYLRAQLLPVTGRRAGTYARIPPGEGVLRMAELIARRAPTATQAPVGAADPAVLLYPGTGAAADRGVVLTSANLVASAFQARLWIPDVLAGREHILCLLPFSSAAGLTWGLALGVLAAATLTVLPRFEPESALASIARRKPTLLPGVPALFAALREVARGSRHDLRSVRVALSCGDALPAELAADLEALTGGRVRACHGSAETAGIICANPVYGRAKRGAAGLPVTDTAVALRDPHDPGQPAAPGRPGRLAVAGPQVMAGYWRRPAETAAVLAEGWLLTEDTAAVDDDGYVAILDRGRDVIMTGGRTVVPREVEAVLAAHPAVRRVVVAGLPDAAAGELVKAYVVLRPGQQAVPEELRAFARGRLAEHEVPRTVEIRGALPDTTAGGALRRRLIEEALASQRQA